VTEARRLILRADLGKADPNAYQRALGLLGRAREKRALYWPAALTEGLLLRRKGRPQGARKALQRVLKLNPKCGRAWHGLGRLALRGFSFETARACIEKLRAVTAEHRLAQRLTARLHLRAEDPESAADVLSPALERDPRQRTLLALRAAGAALAREGAARNRFLARFDALTGGGHPGALTAVGRLLSRNRQYQRARKALRKAIERRPAHAPAHVELGLVLMEDAREEKAAEVLRRATRLDPFHRRAGNQLRLVGELLEYETIETEHFRIKYGEAVDRVLARDMAGRVEAIHRRVTRAYGHEPERRTLIEILPDKERFAVRITGRTDIWTVAASTGDLIALAAPRLDAVGRFDWYRVLRHEYAHTVTLDRTNRRLPHWFTEACAVSQEPGGRSFARARLLANALRENKLFSLREIDWAFIRPKEKGGRRLAYGQAHWMLEYLTARHGHEAVRALLRRFEKGEDTGAAVRAVTGQGPDAFQRRFRAWAREQARGWGLLHQPSPPASLMRAARRPGAMGATALRTLEARFPDHPDVLKARAARALAGDRSAAARRALRRYRAVRPLDPWAAKELLPIAEDTGQTIAALQQLDAQARATGRYAARLARLHRKRGELDRAATSLERAVHREPYRPRYRERAAALALQRKAPKRALRHVEGLTRLEPEHARHQVRLAALHARMGHPKKARAAARRARELDEDAAVGRFLEK
jgi:tetratricopeptide (TPR) repeat protein